MTTHDKDGRRYVRLDELKAGDVIETDDSFDCMARGQHKVEHFPDQGLYVRCLDDHHFLSGQDDGDGHLVGMYKVTY